MTVEIRVGDCLEHLRQMPDESVNCIVTSPPYYGLRDYGVCGQIGMEESVTEHMLILTDVFREAKRVLRSDGTLWVNYGDAYASSVNGRSAADTKAAGDDDRTFRDKPLDTVKATGLKPKDLIGLPWRLAFALQDDGWWLRSDIIWSKPNPMPESVRDRPSRAHEYIFLLTKGARYWYDADAIKTPAKWPDGPHTPDAIKSPYGQGFTKRAAEAKADKQRGHGRRHDGLNDRWDAMSKDGQQAMGANARSVWEIATAPFSEAHFATFPPELAKRCILAGCPAGGIVLDPFGGAGTTGLVAESLGRNAILIELNPKYAAIASRRIKSGLGAVTGVEDDSLGLETLPLFA